MREMENASEEEKTEAWKAQRDNWLRGVSGPTDGMGTVYYPDSVSAPSPKAVFGVNPVVFFECNQCGEVYGENPHCPVHGRGTHWAKANPDICELLDRIANATTAQPDIAALVEAATGIDDDYMTSDAHHPGYVLIPTAKFEAIRAAISAAGHKP